MSFLFIYFYHLSKSCANEFKFFRNPITALGNDEPETTTGTGPAAQLTALLARLTDASSKTMIDAIAIEFAFLNSKAARKRLVKVSNHSSHASYDYSELIL